MKPGTGALYEKKSFDLQSRRYKPTRITVESEALDRVSSLYPKTQVPKFLIYFNTDEWEEQFRLAYERAVNDMQPDSTPGAFYSLTYKDNQTLFQMAPDMLFQHVKKLVEDALTYSFEESYDLFRDTGMAFKVFVKGELHSRSKVEEGRHRLIFASPLPLTIADRMFFGPQNDAEISSWPEVPSKVGLNVTKDGANKLVANVIQNVPNPVSTDMSGWDWHVQGWMLDADIEMRYRLLIGSNLEKIKWLQGARNLNVLLKRKTIMFSDGELRQQERACEGIMASGSYRTSSTNSRMRVLVRYLATGDTNIITYGDDAVETFKQDLVAKYQVLGLDLKPGFQVVQQDLFEFCNKWWSPGKVEPTLQSVSKMVCTLLSHPTLQSMWSIYKELESSRYLEYLVALGVMPSVYDDPGVMPILSLVDRGVEVVGQCQ